MAGYYLLSYLMVYPDKHKPFYKRFDTYEDLENYIVRKKLVTNKFCVSIHKLFISY